VPCARDKAGAAGRVGDATRGRIDQLADGWSLPPSRAVTLQREDAPDTQIVAPSEILGVEIVDDSEVAPLPAPPPLGTPANGHRSRGGEAAFFRATTKKAGVDAVLAELEEEEVAEPEFSTVRNAPPVGDSVVDELPTSPQRLITPLPPVRLDSVPEATPPPKRRAPSGDTTPLPPPAPDHTEPWEKMIAPPGKGTGETRAKRKSGPPALPGTPSQPSLVTPPPLPPPPVVARPSDPTVVADGSAQLRVPVGHTQPLAVRRAGLLGDVGYALAVVRGLAAGSREKTAMRERLALERAARKKRLVEVARAAVADESVRTPLVESARERLVALEENRASLEADAAAAEESARRADDELAVERKRAGETIAELERCRIALEARLKPLERELADRKKLIEMLRGELNGVARRIDGLERKLASAKDAGERAAVEAELAATRAERKQLADEEPGRQAAVAEIVPQIDTELAERARLISEEHGTREQLKDTEAHLAGIVKEARGRRDRDLGEAHELEAARDADLIELGLALDKDRPPVLLHRFRPADEHAQAVAALERRVMEIDAAAASVDRWALVRGMSVLVLMLITVALGIALLLR
jgi:hypothetical protein